ncbi:Transcriptional reguator, TetR family [Pseudomonas syringae pv. rhaphiolepidis]|nr:Transcriptional reguator, TetR family [Pseudomonas syringae pv. rhaphiolepidis]
MATRTKTRERIVQTSLELFNQQGERSVTTNHIAAHMEISPGNLYYHFANKQVIIAELFTEYETLVGSFLTLPADHRRQARLFSGDNGRHVALPFSVPRP